MKRPSFQFYPGDWLHDASLRTCTVGARGLWIEMVCLMHQGSEYGFLKVNLTPILPPNLARMVGATLEETEGWLHELERAGVFSRDESGCIFSRRMIRDEKLRSMRAAGGKLGGNPALKGLPEVGNKVNLQPNLQPTPSSSSSSSSSLIKQKKEPSVPKKSPTADAAARPTKKCPEGFALTPELEAWAKEHCPGVNPHSELEKLKDHTFTSARVDWPGTWRNWMRRAHDSLPRQGQTHSSYAERRDKQLLGAAILTGTYREEKPINPNWITLEGNDGKAS